jgi:hypothetical protein
MKKSLFGFMLVCMIIVSCKKEHSKDSQPGQTSRKVVFNVGFSQQIVDFNTGNQKVNNLKSDAVAATLASKIDILYYAVYDSVGHKIHVIKQLSTGSSFGSYTDILNPGKYSVVVAGGKTGFLLGPDLEGGNATSRLSTDVINYGSYTKAGTSVWNPFNKDAFFKNIAITVGKTDISQSFALDRIVSQMVVNIKDAIPSSVKTIGVSLISHLSDRFLIGTGTAVPSSTSSINVIDTLASSDIGKTNYQISTIFLYSAPFGVQIVASSNLDFVAGVIANKAATATGQPNTQTILSGYLFGGGGSGGISVKIDTAWNSAPIVKTFP